MRFVLASVSEGQGETLEEMLSVGESTVNIFPYLLSVPQGSQRVIALYSLRLHYIMSITKINNIIKYHSIILYIAKSNVLRIKPQI